LRETGLFFAPQFFIIHRKLTERDDEALQLNVLAVLRSPLRSRPSSTSNFIIIIMDRSVNKLKLFSSLLSSAGRSLTTIKMRVEMLNAREC
jgi:hypothetical protein